MALGNEVVAKSDPEDDPPAEDEEKEEEEEEEEEDLIDPVDEVRAECEAKASSQKYFAKLEECNNRVNSRSHTEETCHEEMLDWVHSVDHCVAKTAFSKLK